MPDEREEKVGSSLSEPLRIEETETAPEVDLSSMLFNDEQIKRIKGMINDAVRQQLTPVNVNELPPPYTLEPVATAHEMPSVNATSSPPGQLEGNDSAGQIFGSAYELDSVETARGISTVNPTSSPPVGAEENDSAGLMLASESTPIPFSNAQAEWLERFIEETVKRRVAQQQIANHSEPETPELDASLSSRNSTPITTEEDLLKKEFADELLAPAPVELEDEEAAKIARIKAKGRHLKTGMPDFIEENFVSQDGRTYCHREDPTREAFIDNDDEFEVRDPTPDVIAHLVRLAKWRGATTVEIKGGSETFKKSAWKQTVLDDMDSAGYLPTKEDIKEVCGELVEDDLKKRGLAPLKHGFKTEPAQNRETLTGKALYVGPEGEVYILIDRPKAGLSPVHDRIKCLTKAQQEAMGMKLPIVRGQAFEKLEVKQPKLGWGL